MKKFEDQTPNESPKKAWVKPDLKRESVAEETRAGFAGVKVENMFYNDS